MNKQQLRDMAEGVAQSIVEDYGGTGHHDIDDFSRKLIKKGIIRFATEFKNELFAD